MKALFAHVSRVVVAPSLNRSITGKMLDTNHQAVRCCQMRSLQTADGSLTHARGQVRVFAVAFGDASPPRVATDIQDGSEGHVQAIVGRLDCCNACTFFHRAQVPAGRLTQVDGKDGATSMDYITCKEQRDTQPATLDRHGLQPAQIRTVGSRVGEHRPHIPGCDGCVHVLRRITLSGIFHSQLSDLFLQGHLREQIVDERLLLRVRLVSQGGDRPYRCAKHQHGRECR